MANHRYRRGDDRRHVQTQRGLVAMIGQLSVPAMCVLALIGVVWDALAGEPRRAHPLVLFGRFALWLERSLNRDRVEGEVRADHNDRETSGLSTGRPMSHRMSRRMSRMRGLAAWALAVIPPVALLIALTRWLPAPLAWMLHAASLWFALGARSLVDHIAPIQAALAAHDLACARSLASRVVTRDLSEAEEPAVARAAIESALENGNDAIFGALFWFAIAGGPGALAFRLANTLDAMWGYRTPRFVSFGWAAARLDDVANYVPARLTAATYALCGDWRTAIACWRTQAPAWESPNAGPVMASGAGSLNVSCGGMARYHGVDEARPELGRGREPGGEDIGHALRLVKRSVALWLAAFAVLGIASILR